MKILNIGPLELILVFVLMFIILGPDDMVNIARKLGQTVYRISHSEIFRTIVKTAQEIRQIPGKFIEETGLDETVAQIKEDATEISKEIKDIGLDETVSEVNATANEMSEEVNKATKQLAEPSKIPDKQASKLPAQTGKPVPNTLPAKDKAPAKTAVGNTIHSEATKPADKKVSYPEPITSALLPVLQLSFTETSFDNNFQFSKNVSVHSLVSHVPMNNHLLEPTESLAMTDEELIPVS